MLCKIVHYNFFLICRGYDNYDVSNQKKISVKYFILSLIWNQFHFELNDVIVMPKYELAPAAAPVVPRNYKKGHSLSISVNVVLHMIFKP